MSEWQPIEKAPEKPMPVLLFYPDEIIEGWNGADYSVQIGYYGGLIGNRHDWREQGTNHDVFEESGELLPTHWMPRPPLPLTQEKTNAEARKELVEEVAIALSKADHDERGLPDEVTMAEFYRSLVKVAVSLVGERMAKIVEAMPRTHDKVKEGCCIAGVKGVWTFTINNGPTECAAAIRSLTQEEKQ